MDEESKEITEYSVSIPMMPIKELSSLTKYVAEVKKTLMKKGEDYIIQKGKQYTARKGFAKLAQGFNLSDEIISEEELTRKGEFYGFSYTVRVYNAYGRQAMGVGSCTVDEPNIKHHRDRPYHDVRSIAYTRAWNRAISNFVGSADVSAEEMSIGPDFEERSEVESSSVTRLPVLNYPTWSLFKDIQGKGWDSASESIGVWLDELLGRPYPAYLALDQDDVKVVAKLDVDFGEEDYRALDKALRDAGFRATRASDRWRLNRKEVVK